MGDTKSDLQTATDWTHFKANGVPYHGRLYVDPDTGIIVRMVVQIDFKPTEVIHQEDLRVDYAPVKVGGKMMVLPMKTVIDSEVVPIGDSQAAGHYTTRRTLFTIEYKDYQTK